MDEIRGNQPTYSYPKRVAVRYPDTRQAPALPTIIESSERPEVALPATFQAYLQLVRADLYRKKERTDWLTLAKTLYSDMGFKHCFWLRTCTFAKKNRSLRAVYPLVRAIYLHYQHKHGIWIAPGTQIGPGLYINHVGGIVVNSRAKIGRNCNLSHGVTLGQANRGNSVGSPILGDNVFVGPGAKVIGAVEVGDNAAIGANSVVTKDVPARAVVVGAPAKIISYKSSSGYINATDY